MRVRFTRITVEPGKMGGQPCIRGLRMPVVTVVAMVEDGMTTEQIVADHPNLEAADIVETDIPAGILPALVELALKVKDASVTSLPSTNTAINPAEPHYDLFMWGPPTA